MDLRRATSGDFEASPELIPEDLPKDNDDTLRGDLLGSGYGDSIPFEVIDDENAFDILDFNDNDDDEHDNRSFGDLRGSGYGEDIKFTVGDDMEHQVLSLSTNSNFEDNNDNESNLISYTLPDITDEERIAGYICEEEFDCIPDEENELINSISSNDKDIILSKSQNNNIPCITLSSDKIETKNELSEEIKNDKKNNNLKEELLKDKNKKKKILNDSNNDDKSSLSPGRSRSKSTSTPRLSKEMKQKNHSNLIKLNQELKEKSKENRKKNSIIDMKPIRRESETFTSPKVEDWNLEFQQALDMNEGPEKWETLARIARDFVYCSKTYGKIIISEYLLPDEKKTILPLNPKEIGGIAGGKKYICSSIFFKFALDTPIKCTICNSNDNFDINCKLYHEDSIKWMYGDDKPYDQGAMKAARNDMIGLLSYYNSGVSGLHYPLMSQIDYRGYRLIALSILPIEGYNTLQYGSKDAGKTLYYTNGIAKKMKEVGERLQLKGHRVCGAKPLIYGPGDIEGHLGTDGKYYVLDFARVFPPECPSGPGRDIYYKLLRPEFLRKRGIPLSSDAYSGFGKDNPEDCKEVYAATLYLFTTVVEDFVKRQCSKITKENYKQYRLTEQLHQNGLNCRHLGRVRNALLNENIILLSSSKLNNNNNNSNNGLLNINFLRNYLLSEMLARLLTCILRNFLRIEMKKTKIAAREDPYIDLVFRFLKYVLEPPIPDPPGGCSKHLNPLDQSKKLDYPIDIELLSNPIYWTKEIKILLQQKFRKALTDDEINSLSDIRTNVTMSFVLNRLCKQSGIKLNKHALQEYEITPNSFNLLKFDIQNLSAKVRHLNVIDEAEAKLLFNVALNRTVVRPGLWTATNDKFARAVASNTTNPQTFIQWGKMLMAQWSKLPFNTENYSEVSLNLLNDAYDKFIDAEELQNDLWETHLSKAKIQTIRGVVLQLYATTDAIALSQWYFRDSTIEFKKSFSIFPHCFQIIVSESKKLFKEAKLLKVGFEESIQQKKSFWLLEAYYLLRSSLEVSPVLPNCTIYFKAGMMLYEYLRSISQYSNNFQKNYYHNHQYHYNNHSNSLFSNSNNNSNTLLNNNNKKKTSTLPLSSRNSHSFSMKKNNSSGSNPNISFDYNTNQGNGGNNNIHDSSQDFFLFSSGINLVAEAGLMFESAFLSCGSASDKKYTYTFPDCIYRLPTTKNDKCGISIDVYDSENDYSLEKQLHILSDFSQILLIPFITSNPSSNYSLSKSINTLYSLLNQGDIYGNRYWEITQKSFVLHYPSYNPFLLSKFSLKYISTSPIQIYLIGSTYPHSDIPLESIRNLSLRIPSSPQVHKSVLSSSSSDFEDEELYNELDDAFLIGSFEIKTPDIHEFPLPTSNSCRFLTVIIVPVSKQKHAFRFTGLQFFGFQTQSDDLSSSNNNNQNNRKSKNNNNSNLLPQRPSRPRDVSWIKDKHCNQKISKLSKSKFLVKESTTKKQLLSTSFSIRASPAFTLDWEHDVNKNSTSSSSSSKSKRKRSSIDPVVICINDNQKSMEFQVTVSAALEVYRPKKRLTILGVKTVSELETWLTENDPKKLRKLISKGLLRIVTNYYREDDGKELAAKNVINLIKSKPLWKNILIMVFSSNTDADSLQDEEHFIWSTHSTRYVIDFMAMKWNSGILNFDPFGTFQRERMLNDYDTLKSHTKRQILLTPIRRIRSPSMESDSRNNINNSTSSGNNTPTTNNSSSSIQNSPNNLSNQSSLSNLLSGGSSNNNSSSSINSSNEKINNINSSNNSTETPREIEALPMGPFLYFEINIPKNCNVDEYAIGVTPHQFDVNTLPGQTLGSYAWYGKKGKLFCGQQKSCHFDHGELCYFFPGDIIGCGYDLKTQNIYWTKNGEYIGSAIGGQSSVNPSVASYLFATFGLSKLTSTIEINANFGESQFLFDWRIMKSSIEYSLNNDEKDKKILLSPLIKKEEKEDNNEEELLSLSSALLQLSSSSSSISRSSQLIRKLNPYSTKLFSFCEENQRDDLLILSKICKFSFSLQCLFRAHVKFRSQEDLIEKKNYLCYQELLFDRCEGLREKDIAYAIQLFPKVKNLNISNNIHLQGSFIRRISKQSISNLIILNLEGIEDLNINTSIAIVENCPNLEAIRVWQHIDDESLSIFSNLQSLKNIELFNCDEITDNGISSILKCKKIQIESLQFDLCPNLTISSLKTIYNSPSSSTLKKLRLDNCEGLSDVKEILKLLKKCKLICSFSFAGNAGFTPCINDEILHFICTKKEKSIISLNFYRCTLITKNGFELLSNCKKLEEINIGHLKHIPDDSIAEFAKSTNNLKRLELVSTSISDNTLYLFSQYHKNLNQLSVQRCERLTTNGFIKLLPNLLNIKYLSLKEISIDDKVLELLSLPNILPSLKRLDLRRTSHHCSLYSLANLNTEKPNWIIYDKSNILSGSSDGKDLSTLKFPSTKMNSVRLRKNSL